MIAQEQILRDLDKHASEFNFPVLDNVNVEIADARLTVFKSAKDWLLFFEVVGFSVPEVEFVDDVCAYGSCVYPEGFQGERIVLTGSPHKPIFDPTTGDCIADWTRWSVGINGKDLSFSPSCEDYAEAGIGISQPPGPGSIRGVDILRFLVHRLNHPFFASDDELLAFAPHCKNMLRFFQTTQWQHPDVAGGELPSQCQSIKSLIIALQDGDPNKFDPGVPNTHWRNWLDD